MKDFDPSKLLPHVVAFVLFLGLTLLYFNPFMKGYTLKQGDITNFQGMAQEVVEHREIHGDEPLWVGSMFAGMPAYQISVKYSTHNLLSYVDKALRMFSGNAIFYLFLYMIGFYIFLLCLKIDPWLAIVGAIAFGFSTYFLIILEAGHNSKAHAIAYMAPVFGGIYLTYRGKFLLGGALTAFFLGLELYCNHYQITFYLGLMVIFYGFAEAINLAMKQELQRFAKGTAVLIVAAALAVGANIAQLWNTMEYGSVTTRGKTELTVNPNGQPNTSNETGGLPRDYIMEWSYGVGETFNLFIPAVKGNGSGYIGNELEQDELMQIPQNVYQQVASANSYWGNQRFTSGPVYIGAIIIFLALLCMVYVKSYLKWPLAVVTVLAVMLAWGSNFSWFTDFALSVFPGYNKFRTVAMILVIAEFTLPLMAILYLSELIKNKAEMVKNLQPFYIVSGIVVGGLLLLVMMPGTFFNFLSAEELSRYAQQALSLDPAGMAQQQIMINEIVRIRMEIFTADVWRTLGFVFLAGGAVYAYLKVKELPKLALIGVIGALILADLWLVDTRFLSNEKSEQTGEYANWIKKEDKNKPYVATQADRLIMQIEMGAHPELQGKIQQAWTDLQNQKMAAGDPHVVLSQDEQDKVAFSVLRRTTNNRVLDLTASTFNSSRASYFHKSVGGYHGAKMKRYQELADWYLYNEMSRIGSVLNSQPSPQQVESLMAGLPILNMLNTRYVIYHPDASPLLNNNAMGDAWFVDKAQLVPSADAEIQTLGTADLRSTAIVRNEFQDQVRNVTKDPAATITLESYETNHLTYKTSASSEQLAVFSEIYYHEWNAYIDGQPADHFRTNYVLRGMMVPAGEHTIEFKLESSMYNTGTTLTMICSGLILILLIGAIVLSLKPDLMGGNDDDPMPGEDEKLAA